MSAIALDAPKFVARFVQAGTSHAQAEVLREAFDERDLAAQEQARALHVLQQAVQKLQADGGQSVTKAAVAAHAQQQEERTDGKFETLRAEIKAEFAKADAKVDTLFSKTDAKIDLLRKDTEANFAKTDAKIDLLRKDTEAGFVKMDAKVDLLRKDMEAMQNNLIIKLGGIMVLALGAGAAIMKMMA